MPRTRLLARAITAALLISAACGPSNVAKPPAPTAPGSPTGDPNRGTVGDGGGNVTSRGGGLVVAVPAGATAAPVEISITEITNTAPHGVGRAYRLGPEGTRFTAPVALIFRTDPDASLSDLTIATQDATGYWVRLSNVRRDPTTHTIVATTTHFSDWALVVAPSDRDLSGIFRIASTRDGVVANGVTRFYFESSDEVSDYFYLQSGRITVETPISRPGATCQPLIATKDVGPNIGEIHLGDANPFIWGATGIWDLTCTPTAGGPQTQDFGSVVFENLGLNYPRCTRSYLAPPLVQPEDVQGSYQINCGAEGTINADWHFQRCVPGEVCQTANVCKTAAINCDSGLPLCVENGNVTNGTLCDVSPTAPYEVCGDGVCNVCRIDEACTPTNNCHVGRFTCDTGFEVCTDTGASLANGTVCGTNQVCFTGTCVACTAGTACSTNPNNCVAGTTDCSTGQETCIDTATPIANGTTCGLNQVCFNSACVACTAGTACTTNPNNCVQGTTSCATGQEVCVDSLTPIANGTTCGLDRVCNGGVCVACTAGVTCDTNPTFCLTGLTSCATGSSVCVDNAALPDPNGTVCGTNQVCNNGACNACTAGVGCATNPNPCFTGVTFCGTGVETCVDQTQKANGTACGTNLVCNGGVCNACTEGLSCANPPNPCKVGTTSCATGTSTCIDTAANIPNGTTCDVLPGVPEVCNNGACTACTAGNACATNPNPCVDGTTSCTTGTEQCVNTGTAKTNGTSCGTNQVCNGGTCSACTAGVACSSNSNPCVDGVTSCATGAETCENTATPKTAGTVCGTNQVCNGTGACNACTAGVTCTTNPTFCLTGLTSCSTGAETCVDNPAIPEPNGLTCGTGQVCNGGACATCAAGGSCSTNPNSCVDGVFSCATGTQECVDTATPKTNGTICGTNQVCNGGICSACTAGLACTTNPDPACNDGITSCGTGTQLCTDGAAKPNGTTCGTNQVCNGGTCSACTANVACTTNPNPACLEGITSCTTGTQECLDAAPKPNGTSCGLNLVCNGGVCSSCTAGVTCNTNPTACVLGTTACTSGVPTCEDTATPAPNGTVCDVLPAVPEVCFNGTCNGCVADVACSTNPNPCVTGTTSCATGQQTCENTATTIANGSACDVNPSEPEVCLNGTCNVCSTGISCTTNPNSACMNGVTSCSTGTSVCLDWAPKQDGTTCGTDQVCLAGVCGACSAGDLCSTNPDPCLTGITNCSTGTQACLDNTLVSEPNGTVCGANQVCSGGVCTGCTAGLACGTNPTACLAGVTSCATGSTTCVDSGTSLPDGTGCGTNLVCNAGACVSCTAGQVCATNPAPCLTGTTSCSTGTSVCLDNAAAPEPNGTTCGSNQVCSGGTCTTCVAGQACTTNPDPCKTGTTSCSTGTSVCVDTTTNEPNGTGCGANQVCNGGACVACTAGGACATNPNPCVDGAFSCATGSQTCDNTATNKVAGTACGTNQVCNGSGACVACIAGADCTPANSCTIHQTSCATGSQTCVDTLAPVTNGTVCGTNQVCNGGVCSACTAGQSCTTNPNPCLVGTSSCSTGTQQCLDTAAQVSNGTNCGANQVCNSGACVACAGGGACTTNPNRCVDGVESCATGALTCDNTATVKANGTSCGTDLVCNAGSCVGCVAGAACVTNPNICVAGVTSCATGTQICENGATPTNEGATCGPGLVCNGGACIRVITGTRLVTRWSTTGAGCSAAAPCTTTTVAPDVVSLAAVVEAIGADLTRYPGTFSPSGSFSIPNVPPGPYTLAFTDGAGVTHFIQTSSSTVDLGYDVLGREATAATAPTPVTISVSALSSWIESDAVQITAPDVDLWNEPISGTEIVAGEVGGSVVEDWSATSIGRALNLLAATDVVWMHQLATSTVTADLVAYAYQAATRSAATAVVPDMANGAAASLSATLAPTTQTGNLLIDWRTTQFEALLSSMGPSAQAAANPHALVVRTLPYALSSPAPVATRAPELFRLLQPAGTADANLSTLDPPIVYGRFLDPALWSEWRDTSFTARVSYTAPGAATPVDALARISRREPMLPAPPIQIVPELGTVQTPLVNGANALGTLGAVGPTPTISWSAPLVGAPSSYRVTLRELFVGAGSVSATRVVATFSTSSTSLTVPAGVLVGGRTYFAEIAAQVRSPEQFDTAPNRANTAGSDATTLSATFTP